MNAVIAPKIHRLLIHKTSDYQLFAEVSKDPALPDYYCLEFKSRFAKAKQPDEERTLYKCFLSRSSLILMAYLFDKVLR